MCSLLEVLDMQHNAMHINKGWSSTAFGIACSKVNVHRIAAFQCLLTLNSLQMLKIFK